MAPNPYDASSAADSKDPAIINVLLVDDHTMMREGLKYVLDRYPDIRVIGEATNGEEAVDMAHALLPDVVLMDINMPKMNGIEATRLIKRHHPHIIVIGLSVIGDERHREAMHAVDAYTLLTKEMAVEELYAIVAEGVKRRPAEGG